MPKTAPPGCWLPGDSKKWLFIPPGFSWPGSVAVANSDEQLPKAQPSKLTMSPLVSFGTGCNRWSSPIIMVWEAPSVMSAILV